MTAEPETTGIPQTMDTPEAIDSPETMDAPEMMDAPETMDSAETIDRGATIDAGASESPTPSPTPSPIPPPTRVVSDIPRALEAIFMVADEPQTLVSLATAVGAPIAAVRQSIETLVADYNGENVADYNSESNSSSNSESNSSESSSSETQGRRPTIRRGFELREVGGGWRIYVRDEFDDVVRDFVLTQNPTRLSQAALETLAVIAYKQPISRGAIASIRAVNVDSVVRTLLGRGLITEAYTDSETGAIHYATTDLMLTQLGINSIDELPKISPLLDDGSAGFDDLR